MDFGAIEFDRRITDPGVLIKELEALAAEKQKRGSVKRITNTVIDSDCKIDSWRFNEWDYNSNKISLPVYARGLFTQSNPARIVCRGYDKFFSVGEVAMTLPKELAANTIGPYYLTVKSNGCIAFVSGLEDGTLVVCSKHSTGYRADLFKNHALAAQKALEKQLEQVGIAKSDFAKLLVRLNVTVVCEFCDDEFEEHVLEYKEDKSGLYLHGLNLNTVEFITYPMEKVSVFAELFNFKKTKFIKLDKYEDANNFLQEINKTGVYQGEEIEGFVVRCKKVINNESCDFFYKFKFEEPYLLYRELREVTKSYLRTKRLEQVQFGKHKHKLICMDYLKFVIPMFQKSTELASQFANNKGIIELRKAYFKYQNKSAMDIVTQEFNADDLSEQMKKLNMNISKNPNQQSMYILVTVATIGCGKTTTSLGLKNLHPNLIGHIQNDDIQRPVANKLILKGLEVLVDKPIVILDRNNPKFIERKKIFDDFELSNKLLPRDNVKFICLNFLPRANSSNVLPIADEDLWEVTKNRVVQRSDNHQSINAKGENGVARAEGIMKGFLSRFEPVDPSRSPDSNFDLIIDLTVSEESSLSNIITIDKELRNYCSDIEWGPVDESDYVKAFELAKEYKPLITKNMGKANPAKTQNVKKVKKKKPYYFGIRVPNDVILKIIKETLLPESADSEGSQKYSNALKILTELKNDNRVQNPFHITLIHTLSQKESEEKLALWNKYCELVEPMSNTESLDLNYSADIKLKRMCFDNDLMCIEVEICTINDEKRGLRAVNKHPHITIGTKSNVKAVKSNNLIMKIYDQEVTEADHTISFAEPIEIDALPLFVHF